MKHKYLEDLYAKLHNCLVLAEKEGMNALIEVKKTAEVRQKEQGDIVTAWSKFWGMFGQGHRSSLISTRLHASLM